MSNITAIPPKTTMVPVAKTATPAIPPQDIPLDPLLAKILGTKRAHNSTGDKNFRLWLFSHLKNQLKTEPEIKSGGNILVKVGKGGTTLFSCHVDTVHSDKESDGSGQALNYDPVFGHVFLADKNSSGCLGGDDGVGIYIMLKMIEMKKTGWYMFHVGEERGGIGSRQYVSEYKQFVLDNFEAVVAFDRPVKDDGKPEVILTQGGTRCASDTYGLALAAELNKFEFNDNYAISHAGLFTDSKVYAPFVPECVNLGCFYSHSHTPNEFVDAGQVEILLKAAIGIDWSKLPIVREPKEEEKKPPMDFGNYGRFGGGFDDVDLFGGSPKQQKAKTKHSLGKQPPPVADDLQDVEETIEHLMDAPRAEYEALTVTEPDFSAVLLATLIAENAALKLQLQVLKNFMSAG